MPHIYVKEFNEEKYKYSFINPQIDEVKFGKLFQSQTSSNRFLLFVEVFHREFFIEILKRGDKVLIKSEKNSRPSPNYSVHIALDKLAKIMNLDILSSNLNLKPSPHLKTWDNLLQIENLKNLNGFKERIQIEIGFGSGRHLLDLAEKNINVDFIGIEIYKPAIEQVLKQIKIQNLNNLKVLDFDARQLLETLPSNSIEAIYLHFPVPWDEQPHRRVLSKRFFDEVKRVLNQGGIFELRTDSEELFKSSMELFLNEPQIKFELQKNIKIDVESKYESRWLKMQKNIYNLKIESLEISNERQNFYISKNKNIAECINRTDNFLDLIGKRELKTEWFLNFIDILDSNNINGRDRLFQIVGGTYLAPSEIFLMLNKNQIEYLIKSPLEIEVYSEIDKYLRELFELCY